MSDHDVERSLTRYVTIAEGPFKPVDQFILVYSVPDPKVQIQRDEQNQQKEIPNSISLRPHSDRIFYPGQIPKCFICASKDHQVKDCEQVKCWRCGHLGHKAKDCNNSECNLCGQWKKLCPVFPQSQ